MRGRVCEGASRACCLGFHHVSESCVEKPRVAHMSLHYLLAVLAASLISLAAGGSYEAAEVAPRASVPLHVDEHERVSVMISVGTPPQVRCFMRMEILFTVSCSPA